MRGVSYRTGSNGMKLIAVQGYAVFKGKQVRDMTSWERSKVDNMLFLRSHEHDRVPTKIIFESYI